MFSYLFYTALVFVHLYLLANLRRLIGGGWWQIPVLALMAASFVGIVLSWRSLRRHDDPAVLWREAIYYWLGLLVILAIFGLGRDLLQGTAWLFDCVGGTSLARIAGARWTFAVALSAGVLAFAHSLHAAQNPRVATLTLSTDLLPEGRDRVRIVAFSDLHVTRVTTPERIRRVVDLVNRQNPDIVVVLGDLMDDYLRERTDLSDALAGLRAPEGKFAILGNHDVFSRVELAEEFFVRSGLTLLRGAVAKAAGIAVVGVDDPYVRGRVGVADALRQADAAEFVLLLTHRPETPEKARGLFDLQLSGHTHGGQIWPMAYVPRLIYGYPQGLSILPGGDGGKTSRLFITNGVGQWGPQVRFLAPPEIVVIDVERE